MILNKMEQLKFSMRGSDDGKFKSDQTLAMYLRLSTYKILALVVLSLLLGLIPLIIIYWSKKALIYMAFVMCQPSQATHIKIVKVYFHLGQLH